MSQFLVLLLLLPSLVLWTPAYSNPSGGVVVHGDAMIGSGARGNLQIRQNSRNAIIEWDDFSIDAGELTRFAQPGANAAVLNRVTGLNPSAINGALKANGNVLLINPSGILVGPSGTIDVHGLVLSTLDVSNGEFLAGGDMVFKGNSDAGVTNMGRINAIGGDVFLMARTVANSGSISATGTVGLGAGREVLLTADETATGERMFVRSTGAGASGVGVLNDGTIEGAAVELKAHGNVYALAINNKGSIRATGAESRGGRVFLEGIGGDVRNGGTIRATAPSAGQSAKVLIKAAYAKVDGMISATDGDGSGGSVRISGSNSAEVSGSIDVASEIGRGGDVVVEGEQVGIGPVAQIDASGTGGGNIRVGGGFRGQDASILNAQSTLIADGAELIADATADGDAGSVVVWADGETQFNGSISAEAAGAGNGGFAEVSGKDTLIFDGAVSTLSAGGNNGTLLLDPTDFEVVSGVAGANQINDGDLETLLGSNNVAITTSDPDPLNPTGEPGTITVEAGADVNWNADNSLTMLAHQDINIFANIQNEGTGGVYLVAGWDGMSNDPGTAGASNYLLPTTPITADSFSAGEYGLNNGTVTIDASSQGVSVGSMGGDAQVAAFALNISGGAGGLRQAQLGFNDSPFTGATVDGNIGVYLAGGGLQLSGNNNRSYAQVGHGSFGGSSTLNGDVTIEMSGGDVMLAGGTGTDAYAQIGHGGRIHSVGTNSEVKTGDIDILGFSNLSLGSGDGDRAYTQIGHGGHVGRDGKSGNIILTGNGDGDISLLGGQGAGTESYAQIGMGGQSANNQKSGWIEIDQVNNVSLTGGENGANYAQIGVGGRGASGGPGSSDSHITINADENVIVHGGNSSNAYAQIGIGGQGQVNGAVFDQDIHVTAGGYVSVKGGNGVRAYGQIGHGGDNSEGAGGNVERSGDVTVTANGADADGVGIRVEAVGRENAYAQIGHGGSDAGVGASREPSFYDGDVSVLSNDGDVLLKSGDDLQSYSQIGHGGAGSAGANQGEISVESVNGNVTLDASEGGDEAYVQIGHGGHESKVGDNGGTIAGGDLETISVRAGNNVELFSGGISQTSYSQNETYAMIGNGGYDADADPTDDAGNRANIVVAAGTDGSGSVILQGGGANNDNNGAFGFNSAFTQIGNGGAYSSGDHSGDITVTAADDVRMSAGNDVRNYAQIGNGGYDSDGLGDAASAGHSGTISVTTGEGNGGSISLTSTPVSSPYYNAGSSYVQIGHGGINSDGNHDGDIIVDSDNQISLANGRPDNGYSQIGNGGMSAIGDMSGSISVTATNDIDVRGGTNDRTYAQIGHGGYQSTGNHSADFITVTSESGEINVVAGQPAAFRDAQANASHTYAQIGLGGGLATGNMSAPITVTASGDVYMEAGGVLYNYTQIGNGGYEATGDKSGTIEVTSENGKVSVLGSRRQYDTYALLGHGGVRVDGTLQGDISVSAANGVEVSGGRREAERSFAQVGHGGLESVGDKSGAIDVNADSDGNGSGDLEINGGSPDRAYALIGHGGIASDGFLDGRIDVNVGGALSLIGGSGAAVGLAGDLNFAMIGHSLAGALGGYFLNDGSPDYAGRNGLVVGEGEYFSSTDDWDVLAEGTLLPQVPQPAGATETVFYEYLNARGGFYAQNPDVGTRTGATTGSYVEYTFTVDESGDYRFTPRWGSYNGNSDSIFFDIKEIKDGTTGDPNTPGVNEVPDWYEFTRSSGGVFSWDNTGGGYEQNAAGDNNGDPLWNLTAGTEYTLRITPRESGSAIDAWALELDGLNDLSGFGPGATFANRSGVSGASDITVSVGGDISVTSGVESDSYAAIGHGGSSFAGVAANVSYGSDMDGADISVTSAEGNILLDGNSAASAGAARGYATIGHHGVDAGFDAFGDVEVKTGGAAATVELRGGSGTDNFAKIGHGGAGEFLDGSSTLSGDVDVMAFGGIDLSSPSSGDRSFAQIGHGAYGLAGDFDGDINVVSPDGAVSLTGGSGSTGGQYAQIGHGGLGADGTLTGDLYVVAGNGDLTLAAGDADDSYVLTGHGDAAGTSLGARAGGVHLFSSGQLTTSEGAGTGSGARIFHQTSSTGGLDANYTTGDGFQIVANDGYSLSGGAAMWDGVSAMISGNLASGKISVAIDEDVDVVIDGPGFSGETDNDFSVLTGGSITMNTSFRNSGTGPVNLIAGWSGENFSQNGSVSYSGTSPDFNYCEPTITSGGALDPDFHCDDAAAVGTTLTIGNAAQTSEIEIGSAFGTNTYAGSAVMLTAADSTNGAFTHLGYRPDGTEPGPITSGIDLYVGSGGLSLTAAATDAYVQIGHGGNGASDVSINADINTSFCESGDLTMTSGEGARAYTHVGHGGNFYSAASANGAITIGQVDPANDAGFNNLTMTSGDGSRSYSQIGNGGYASDGDRTGSVTLSGSGTGSVDLSAGLSTGLDSFVQIGNGGRGSDGAKNGAISLTGVVDVSLSGGSETRNYAQIGNGGHSGNGGGNGENDITVSGSGNLEVVGGTGLTAYAQIGHGGWGQSGTSVNDDITVDMGGWIKVSGDETSADAANSYAQIGHGGTSSDGEAGDEERSGNIRVSAGASDSSGNAIQVLGGSSSFAQAMIGHGGRSADISYSGSVDIDAAGSILVEAGQGGSAFAQIGHGGEGSFDPGRTAGDAETENSGAITIDTTNGGSLTVQGHQGAGVNDANIDSRFAYAQVGHGGRNADGDHSGSIDVNVEGGLLVRGGANQDQDLGEDFNYALIGNGGDQADGAHSGDISLQAGGDIAIEGGDGRRSYAQVGNGGYTDTTGDSTGNISVISTGGDISLVGGQGNVGAHREASYAQIGHGGISSSGNLSGNIVVAAESGAISMTLGSGDLSYKLIGHGGRGASGDFSGAISVTALNKIDAIGGNNDFTFAQIGHGGADARGSLDANVVGVNPNLEDGIEVTSTSGRVLVRGGRYNATGADGRRPYAQIGLGGYNTGGGSAAFDADIRVEAGNGILVDGGGRDFSYGMVGNGGDLSQATKSGDISVTANDGTLYVRGGGAHELSAGQIGHGGFRAFGTATGDIEVKALGGEVIVRNGGGEDSVDNGGAPYDPALGVSYSYGQIGHGGAEGGDFDRSGVICVVGVEGVSLLSNQEGERAYTQIGHGGYETDGDFSGDVKAISPDGDVDVIAGDLADGQYAQIGHGGINSDGYMDGTVTVIANNGDTTLEGGDGDNSYAMIGHGDGAKTSTGRRGGGVRLFSSGQLTGTNGSGTGSNVYIFHQNENGLQPADYDGGGGYQKVANGGVFLPPSALVDESTIMNGNIGVGTVTIRDSNQANNYLIDASYVPTSDVNTTEDFYVVVAGNLTMTTSYQNAGSGDVTLVAGWDGSSGSIAPGSVDFGDPVNFCDPVIDGGGFTIDFTNCEAWGQNGKVLTVGSATQTERVSVGTAGGTNIFAGAGVELYGSDTNSGAGTQLGFYADGSAEMIGGINVYVKDGGNTTRADGIGGLILDSGSASGAFTQIGHGGLGSTGGALLDSAISITFCETPAPGALRLLADGPDAYAQIGHGGEDYAGDVGGDIKVDRAGSLDLQGGASANANDSAYAQIGHGGNKTAVVNIDDADIAIDVLGAINLDGGSGTFDYAQIGHGGRNPYNLNITGSDILINTGTNGAYGGGDISLTGGGSNAYAQIGHGGARNDGGLVFGSLGGDIDIGAAANILLNGGVTTDAYAQIGHGGEGGNGGPGEPRGTVAGDISLASVGEVSLNGGNGTDSYVQIGHGGDSSAYSTSAASDITVSAGSVSLNASTSQDSYAQIGHGGSQTAGDTEGDIAIIANNTGMTDGSISVNGGSAGTRNYAQIGHGGTLSSGDAIGDIFINTNPDTLSPSAGTDVVLAAGSSAGAYAQVGHGGLDSQGNATGGITLNTQGDLSLLASGEEEAYALLGHGGVAAPGYLDGDIAATVGGAIDILGGGDTLDTATGGNNFAQIGHSVHSTPTGFGGFMERNGQVVVEGEYFDTADDWELVSYDGTEPVPEGFYVGARGGRYVLVPEGAGGSSPATASNEITYTFTITEGGEYRLFPRWSGYDGASDSLWADIVSVKDGAGGEADYYFFAGRGASSFGWDTNSGFEDLSSGGAISNPADAVWNLAPGEYTLRVNPREDGVALDAFVLQDSSFGNPGMPEATFASNAGVNGSVDVRANGDIGLSGGINSGSHAAIGHGGSFLDTVPGTISYGSESDMADVTVISNAGSISLTGGQELGDGGSTAGRYAAIGHHGTDSKFNAFGNVRVEALGGDLELVGGSGESSGARIGHGGNGIGATLNQNATTMSGSVDVVSAGGIALNGGGALGSDANGGATQIGHGGIDRAALISGAVTVDASGLLELMAGAGARSFARIGHGGININGEKSQAVSVVAGNLEMSGGDDLFAHAQIGHGGSSSGGIAAGNVDVLIEDTVEISGGSGGSTFAHIGHGGSQASGAKSGSVTLEAGSINAQAGAASNSYVQVGHGGASSSGNVIDAAVSVSTTVGGIRLAGGSENRTFVQVGHGGTSYGGAIASQPILIESVGDLMMNGGSGSESSVHIGHGGFNASGIELSGAILANVDGNLELVSGTAVNSYTQIGHGGALTDGNMSGLLQVNATESITMTSLAELDTAYSKIGHGDDITGDFAVVAGSGLRDGDIEVAAGDDILMTNAMIGHVNSLSSATAIGGVTQIGVSRDDPTDPSGGSLVADADSEFSGGEELRFYLPRRGNNEIASGALLNGSTYAGARTDPSATQGADEYTINIIGDQILFPDEHGNVFDSGPAPAIDEGFAFYYDTIVLAAEDDVVVDTSSNSNRNLTSQDSGLFSTVFSLPGLANFFPDDRTVDDAQRKKEKFYSGFYPFFIYYEGFTQYSPSGKSIFSVPARNSQGNKVPAILDQGE